MRGLRAYWSQLLSSLQGLLFRPQAGLSCLTSTPWTADIYPKNLGCKVVGLGEDSVDVVKDLQRSICAPAAGPHSPQ